MKILKTSILLLIISVLFSSCFVSRLERPEISGTIVDFDNNPIVNCAVGEAFTDKDGKFILEEQRYYEFVPIIVLEAPPIFIHESINKEGYETKEIHTFSKYGGGAVKGAKWKLDSIHLKSTSKKINLNKFLKTTWQASATQKFDTLVLIRREISVGITDKYRAYYNKQQSLSDNAQGGDNLPENVILRYIDLNFSSNDKLATTVITVFGNKGSGYASTKPNDTLITKGKWQLNDAKLKLISPYSELNGTYKFDEIDYKYIQLVKQ